MLALSIYSARFEGCSISAVRTISADLEPAYTTTHTCWFPKELLVVSPADVNIYVAFTLTSMTEVLKQDRDNR